MKLANTHEQGGSRCMAMVGFDVERQDLADMVVLEDDTVGWLCESHRGGTAG